MLASCFFSCPFQILVRKVNLAYYNSPFFLSPEEAIGTASLVLCRNFLKPIESNQYSQRQQSLVCSTLKGSKNVKSNDAVIFPSNFSKIAMYKSIKHVGTMKQLMVWAEHVLIEKTWQLEKVS